MSDEPMNEQLVLVGGYSGTGKSASLRNIKNQEKWMYLNTEAGKRLPFKNSFKTYKVIDPYQVLEGFDYAIANPNDFDGIIVDSLTFLMDMYESMYVLTAANTMKAWSDYQQFFKELMQSKVAAFGKPVIIIAHVKDDYDEKAMEVKTSVPVKGALKNNGVEAYFSTVVSAKKVTLNELEKYSSGLLKITDDEKELGYKHVFQTRPTKATVGDRIRSPMGMFSRDQTYIDNDAAQLIDHLKEFYN